MDTYSEDTMTYPLQMISSNTTEESSAAQRNPKLTLRASCDPCAQAKVDPQCLVLDRMLT